MSKRTKTEIECPHCGNKQDTEVWSSLNVTLDPEAKEALFNGKINFFCCQKCRWEGMIPVDLLYHDMRRRFCVQFYPFEWIGNNDFIQDLIQNIPIEGELPPAWPPMTDFPPYMQHMHIVFDMGELVRYVIFKDRLFELQHSGSEQDTGSSTFETGETCGEGHDDEVRRIWANLGCDDLHRLEALTGTSLHDSEELFAEGYAQYIGQRSGRDNCFDEFPRELQELIKEIS